MVDLYRKPTDRNQYLLTSSCHPSHVTQNIPYSLALRIVRICSVPKRREERFVELKNLLIARDYKTGLIDAAIDKARKVSRSEALKRVKKSSTTQRPVFAITYDPRLPSIAGIMSKHWRTMTKDPHLAETFPQPPLVAYRRPKNIRDKLIRSKVPAPAPVRPKRKLNGMTKCNRSPICPFVKVKKAVKSTASRTIVDINMPVNCQTKNVIYCIECNKCTMQYIGETDRSLQTRFSEHRGYVTNKMLRKATGNHFNQPGHTISNMEVTILEKVHNRNGQFRKAREKMFIEDYNTKYKGMNRKS